MLPELVDGRTVFQRDGEVITMAHLKDQPDKHYYCSNIELYEMKKIKPSIPDVICCFVMGDKNHPDDRQELTWISRDQLVFY